MVDQMNRTEPQAQGYVVPTDALERLERLVGVLSEPLVAFTAELAAERDDARDRARRAEAMSSRLTKALAYLVKEWPTTSWGTSEEARDTAQALLDEIEQEGATMGSPEQPADSGEPPTHGRTDSAEASPS